MTDKPPAESVPNPRFLATENWMRATEIAQAADSDEEAVAQLMAEFGIADHLAQGVLDTPLRSMIQGRRRRLRPSLRSGNVGDSENRWLDYGSNSYVDE